MMRGWLYAYMAFLGTVYAQVDLVKQQAEINSAKADLEEARQIRDRAIAERWQDRQKNNEEREKKLEQIRETKERVEALSAERSRLIEEMRALREDVARLKGEAERARDDFLLLSAQQDRIDALARSVEQGIPWDVPQRIQAINRLRRDAELFRDDPGRVASLLLKEAVRQMFWTRDVVWEEGDLVFGSEVVRGQRVRLGGVGGIQWDAAQGRTALLLASSGERGRAYTWQTVVAEPVRRDVARAFAQFRDSAVVLLPVDILLSTALSGEMAAQKEMDWPARARKFFRDGGVLMYPIAGLFALALLLAIERTVVVFLRGRGSRRRLREIEELCRQGDLVAAQEKARKIRGSLGAVVRAVLRNPQAGRAAAEKALEEVFADQVPRLESRLNVISVCGSSAPLLGLLGTVMGMIQLFDVITLYGTSDPKLLAGGISVALITTEAGLMVAIPVQLLHTWIANRVENLVVRMETTALRLLNILWVDK